MTCHCFSGSPLSSGQFRIKVFLRAVTRGARRGCGRGALTAEPGVGPRAHRTRACSPGRKRCSGRAAAAGSPRSPRAVPGPALPGTECLTGLPRTCPSRTRLSGRGPRGSRAPGTGRGQPPAEPRPRAPALPGSPQARAPSILQGGAPSRLPGPPRPLPCSRAGCERRRGSGTAARAAPTLPPESGVEHSASPRGANEEDVAATAPPTSRRGTAARRPASRHARPGAQREGPGAGSRRPQGLHAPRGT